MRFFISFSPLPCWGGRSREHLGGLWQPAQVNIFVWIYLHIIPIWVWEKNAALGSASIEHQVLRHCQDGWRWEYLEGAIRGVWEWCKQNLFCLLPFFAILLPFRGTKLSRIAPVLRLHEDHHSRQGDFTTASYDSARNFTGLGSAVWFHGLQLGPDRDSPEEQHHFPRIAIRSSPQDIIWWTPSGQE